MVEVTEADIATALAHLGFHSMDDLHYWAMDDNELNRFDALAQAFATHRIEAAKAERDRCEKIARDYAAKAAQRGWVTYPESAATAAKHIATAIKESQP